MRMNQIKAGLVLSAVAVLSACGGSPDMVGNLSAKISVCDTPLSDAVSAVAGTVAGRYYHYEGDARYTASGEQRSISVEDLFDHRAKWGVANVTPAVGSYSCDDVNAPFVALIVNGQQLDSALGDCSVTVTAVNGQGMQGRFSATLQNAAGSVSQRVEDGCFNVVFDDAILDADLDGLADADDGCPFDAANNCLEQPANINSCAIDEQA